MNVRSERKLPVSFSACVALLVLSAGCLFAQSSGTWAARQTVPHVIAATSYSCSDMVFVRHCESTFVFLYTDSLGVGSTHSFFNAYSPQLHTWSGDLPVGCPRLDGHSDCGV